MAPSGTEPRPDHSISTMPTWLCGMYTQLSQDRNHSPNRTAAAISSQKMMFHVASPAAGAACAHRGKVANRFMRALEPERSGVRRMGLAVVGDGGALSIPTGTPRPGPPARLAVGLGLESTPVRPQPDLRPGASLAGPV